MGDVEVVDGDDGGGEVVRCGAQRAAERSDLFVSGLLETSYVN